MPLSNPFANRRIVEAVKAIREHPDAAYGIAIGLVAFATLTRWAMGDYIGAHIPFITFFPAIIIGAGCLAGCLRRHPGCARGMVPIPSACL